MQSLIKGTLNTLKLTGLNTNMIVYRFARMARPRKTFAEVIDKKEEQVYQIPKEEEPTIDNKLEAPEDFEEGEEVVASKAPKAESEELQENNALIFRNNQQNMDLEERLKTLDHETKKFIKEELLYPGYDPHPEKLVQRPAKDVVWGLGGQLLKRKTKFFEKGKMPEVDDVIRFLESEHAKDVVLVDLEKYGRTDLPRWGIILSGYSSRHLYRMATALAKSIKDIDIPGLVNPPRVHGRRDDDWIMVDWRGFMVHMFTEDTRYDFDLEGQWTRPESDGEEEEDLEMLKREKNRHKLYQTYKGEQ